uniref:Co-chaperonin GroES n=1 Tax=uncultured virus TaxID=340016 RepID=A0A221S3Y8_9VIRU|nr:co-chaperonin GroES [uncultured virus]
MENITAIGKYILVDEVKEQEKASESGLFLGSKQTNELRYKKVTVLAVGTECHHALKEGLLLYVDKTAGHPILVNGASCYVIREQDVVLVC